MTAGVTSIASSAVHFCKRSRVFKGLSVRFCNFRHFSEPAIARRIERRGKAARIAEFNKLSIRNTINLFLILSISGSERAFADCPGSGDLEPCHRRGTRLETCVFDGALGHTEARA